MGALQMCEVVKRVRNAYNNGMEFLKEIAKSLGADGAGVFRVQYTVVDGKGGYFQNVKRLVTFTEREIVLRGREGAVRIEGEGLSLGRYFAGDLVIMGDIIRVERMG